MKEKGFTLVELLAVIIILAVIALISTPMIINVIEGSKKGALKDSAYGLLEAADIYYAEHVGGNKKTEFTFEDGKQTSIEQVGYKGYVEKGSMYLYSDGKKALCISDGKYAAIKNVDEEEVRMSSGRCSYNEATEEYETVGICSDLESELEKVKEENNKKLEEIRNEYEERISNLTNDYEEQKKTIENTYKNQIEELNRRIEELEANKEADIAQIRAEYEDRIKTQKEAYEAQINELNRQLNIFKTGGTASASDIASGKTAYVNGELITGSMEDRGAVNISLNVGESYTIPAGYHNGSGKVTANSLGTNGFDMTTKTYDFTYTVPYDGYVYIDWNYSAKNGPSVSSQSVLYLNDQVLSSQSGNTATGFEYNYHNRIIVKVGDVIKVTTANTAYTTNITSICLLY